MAEPQNEYPRRGEIWFIRLPSDPTGKGSRPVVVVSLEARNRNPRATTVMTVPLSTTLREFPGHVRLQPGETGLHEISEAQPENLHTVHKEDLARAKSPLRKLGESRLKEIARGVVLALGFCPGDI